MTDRTCTVEGCGKPFAARGMCTMHYQRTRRHGTPDLVLPPGRRRPVCAVAVCDRFAQFKGYCSAHYSRMKCGTELDSLIRPKAISGGGTVDSRGYVLVTDQGGRRISAHRLVMETLIGRPLLRHENVHHVNGNRADNRPENLELWSTWQPSGQRVDDKVAWAIELLELYRPDALA